jgi:hypothetical protein
MRKNRRVGIKKAWPEAVTVQQSECSAGHTQNVGTQRKDGTKLKLV